MRAPHAGGECRQGLSVRDWGTVEFEFPFECQFVVEVGGEVNSAKQEREFDTIFEFKNIPGVFKSAAKARVLPEELSGSMARFLMLFVPTTDVKDFFASLHWANTHSPLIFLHSQPATHPGLLPTAGEIRIRPKILVRNSRSVEERVIVEVKSKMNRTTSTAAAGLF
ncbi:hypothetical protein GALMADRAFT_224331 [Galerina marginata CBS 339.88]|uniref:Uncharacterized protein n=1 Tax=Galerina marginata (strain CBS 339.88) TaxID=685588 RepID=A0A067T434_GALM3|nr:hypothetical protein GALMADRAFT_224331 [Galerina marginata CBS 339.88]